MMTTAHLDVRALRRLTLSMLSCLIVGIMVVLPAAVVGAQEDEAGPGALVVHRVDATGDETEVAVLADTYDAAAFGASTIVENGEEKQLLGARSARSAGDPVELVVVVDTTNVLAQGDVFERATAALADEVRALSGGEVAVGVVAAGETAVVRQTPTTDLAAAAAAIEALELTETTALFNAIDRSATLFSDDPEALRTVVVFSGGSDTGSSIGAVEARRALTTARSQIVAVRYGGGEAGLQDVADGAGGLSLAAGTAEEAEDAVQRAVTSASDRFLLTYNGTTSQTQRADVQLQVGSASTGFSYPGGLLTDRAVALELAVVEQPPGPAFLRSTVGLYLAVGLAAAGIGLAIYAGASLFGGVESSLEGMLRRYSGEEAGAELTDEEQALVQTALVKKAVEFSESFAEDQGFLGKIEEMLERANLPLRPGEAMSFFVAACFFALVGGYVLTRSLVLTFVISLVTAVGLFAFVRVKAARRIRSFEKQLPDTLTLLAGTLRAGYSLPQGLEAVSHEIPDPMGYELRRVMTEARLGREMEDALAASAERLSSPDFAWAVMAIGIQREVGGNLSELLMTVADTMIARERLKGEVAALTAEGRMSAVILGGLPPGLGFVMWLMNPEYISTLFTETLGHILLGLGFVSVVIGMAWMKKVITINV